MPRFPTPEGYEPITYLREVSELGLRDRLDLSDTDLIDPEYLERLI